MAGDFDGDGYGDFAVGATGVSSDAGAVYLVYGSSSPASGAVSLSSADVRFDGEASGDLAGSSLSGGGT